MEGRTTTHRSEVAEQVGSLSGNKDVPDATFSESPHKATDPIRVYLEIVGTCMAKCPYCPTGRGSNRSGQFLDPSHLERILVHLFDNGLLSKRVSLYNYGEPFLHPQLDEILRITAQVGLKADLSSNFIRLPVLSDDALHAIGSVGFSLSGITDASYRRIHGANIYRVLGNFNLFREQLLQVGRSDVPIYAFWHMYRFNLPELEVARAYFEDRKVCFVAYPAYVGDVGHFLDALRGEIASADMERIRSDLLWEYVVERTACLREDYPAYECRQHQIITINERGRLAGCCGLASNHLEYDLGEAMEMDAEEMFRRKRMLEICGECVRQGVAQYLHMHERF